MEEDLSELWLKNLKDLISSQNAKIKQLKSDNEFLTTDNKSLKCLNKIFKDELIKTQRKNAQLENELDELKGVKRFVNKMVLSCD